MNFFDRFKEDCLVIAHRGYSEKYPENTKVAFEKALAYTSMVEFDIQLTKDKEIIVLHDKSLERTSNVKEVFPELKSYKTWNFALKELKSLDFSSWFDKSIKKQEIITLDEILKFAKNNKLFLNIEIKDIAKVFNVELFVDLVYKKLIEVDIIDKVIVSSFNHKYIKELKNLREDIAVAALFDKDIPKDLLTYLKDLKVDSYHVELPLLKKQDVKTLEEENIKTLVFTVNDVKTFNKLKSWGVRGVYSDKNLFE